MSGEKKTSISGKVDAKIYKEFVKETSYQEVDKWEALSEAMKMYTKKLKKDSENYQGE